MLAGTPTPGPLTEARLTDITCNGLHVTQTGLPASRAFEVHVLDPVVARVLTEQRTASDPGGNLDVVVAVSLRGLTRVHVEVERVDTAAEYAEVDADLDLPCTPHPASTAPSAAIGPATSATRGASSGPPLWLVPVGIGALAVAGGWVLLRRRR